MTIVNDHHLRTSHDNHDIVISFTGYDFTGQWGDAHSLGVTVDDTPPSHDSMWLGSEIALSLNSGYSVAFGWSPVVDTGSGVVGLDWCFGSRPGTSDLHQWTGLQSPYTLRTAAQGLGLADGQLLFASMLVRRAGVCVCVGGGVWHGGVSFLKIHCSCICPLLMSNVCFATCNHPHRPKMEPVSPASGPRSGTSLTPPLPSPAPHTTAPPRQQAPPRVPRTSISRQTTRP